MARLSPILSVMSEAANKSAPRLRRDYSELIYLQTAQTNNGAGGADFVQHARARVQSELIEALNAARADYCFVIQGKMVSGSDKTHHWVVAPIAGEVNFSRAQPHFAIAIALLREGVVQAGLIYQPIDDEMIYADIGNGAFSFGASGTSARARVAPATPSPAKQLIACDDASFAPALNEAGYGLRITGGEAADYAWLASGRLDAKISTRLYDKPFADILMQEAGGVVYANDELMISGNEAVVENLRALLNL